MQRVRFTIKFRDFDDDMAKFRENPDADDDEEDAAAAGKEGDGSDESGSDSDDDVSDAALFEFSFELRAKKGQELSCCQFARVKNETVKLNNFRVTANLGRSLRPSRGRRLRRRLRRRSATTRRAMTPTGTTRATTLVRALRTTTRE